MAGCAHDIPAQSKCSGGAGQARPAESVESFNHEETPRGLGATGGLIFSFDMRFLVFRGRRPCRKNPLKTFAFFAGVRHSHGMSKQVLGRGLGALLGGHPPAITPPGSAPAPPLTPSSPAGAAPAPGPEARERILQIPLNRIRPCPLQPRKDFPAELLQELADSIKEQGIIQPLIVRERGDGYQIIAGERRWRAAQLAGLQTIPVILRQADDRSVLEMMLIENLQREDLNPIEEALGYADLIAQFQLTQETVAGKVGKSRAVVANALRLLKLPPDLQAWLKEGRLSVGHAKVILGLLSPEEQSLAAEKVLTDGLNVRQLEELVALWQSRPVAPVAGKPSASPAARDVHVVDLENRLQERFATKVTLRYRKGKGSVQIRFYSDEELERILDISGIKMD
jgi:ParB family chromosome partitioning protein